MPHRIDQFNAAACTPGPCLGGRCWRGFGRGGGSIGGGAGRGGRRGFSLIELLVVITILAIILAVLLPSMAASRASADAMVCSANLRQWGTAVNSYANGNKGFLPRRGQGVQPAFVIDRPEDWFNALPPELGDEAYVDRVEDGTVVRPGGGRGAAKSVWLCPCAADVPGSSNYFAYGMNMLLSTWATAQPDRIDGVAPPHEQVFMADGPGLYCSVAPSTHEYSPLDRHKRSVTLVFLDTHAGQFEGQLVGCHRGDPRLPEIQWRVPGMVWGGPE